MVRSKTLPSRLADGLIAIILTLAAVLCLAPIIHTLAISLSDRSVAAAGDVYFWPVGLNLTSYETLLEDGDFFRAFGVSLQRVLIGGSLNFILTVLMAYPLSKFSGEFKLRNFYMWFLVFTMLFNAGLIPTYLVVTNLGLTDTIWALVLPHGLGGPGAVPVFNVILLMNFFRGLPKELDEAGVVDGAGPWYMLFWVYIPLGIPAIATVTLFSIVMHWNAFFDGLIFMNNPSNYPLQTYIQQLVVQVQNMSQLSAEEQMRLAEISERTLNAAKLIISMIPILIVYPFLQRFFIHGIVLGSVKE